MRSISGITFPSVLALAALQLQSSAWGRQIRLPRNHSEIYSSVVLCTGMIPGSLAGPPVDLSLEAYIHAKNIADGTTTFRDVRGFVTQVHQTTSNIVLRDAQSAIITSTSTGGREIKIDTQSMSGCRDCYTVQVSKSATGDSLTGTVQFVGRATSYPLECDLTSQ